MKPLVRRELEDGMVIELHQYIFNLRLMCFDPISFEISNQYCYHSRSAAIVAAATWDGVSEPDGWFKNPNTNQYNPNFAPKDDV